ncbi:NUDIX domain-containing protein [Segetibacter sp. 3557_3]|uniref:NUDIX domain-containing protein n=1 Tax=Segetibacter sp. 3557_3 TaxID=2547429 RepID=UPI0010585DCF|nr:NUDIX domain-containing protein [Segetibacter sp. 3557_3]TDH27517.1 NUDIX domain-containing protein [Segetibacter sp. 3557_3]
MAAGDINITDVLKLSAEKFILNKITFDFTKIDGSTETQVREIYDHGNGATVLLYNRRQRTIILIRQLRIASYINGNPSGLLIETCAGLLDNLSPEEAIVKEISEETGFEITNVKKIMELYTSPGADTELLHFFVAEYDHSQKKTAGGGLNDEQEDIEVMEVPFDEAYQWLIEGKIKDAKTAILILYAKLNNLIE